LTARLSSEPEHIPVFDCSLDTTGGRSIAWRGHVKMMAAAQPSSPAPSARPQHAGRFTIEDIMDAYIESWKLGASKLSPSIATTPSAPNAQRRGNKKDEKKSRSRRRRAEPVQRELFARTQREKLPSSATPSPTS